MTRQTGYIGKPPTKSLYRYNLMDNKVIEAVSVVVFNVDISDMYVSDYQQQVKDLIKEFKISDQYTWLKTHALEELQWHTLDDIAHAVTKFAISAKLAAADATFWQLKWGIPS